MKNISIEIRIITFIALFITFLVSVILFHLNNTTLTHYKESIIAKNRLLINTIEPIVNLNISFGLQDANNEYLKNIMYENREILAVTITKENKTLFSFPEKISSEIYKNLNELNHIEKDMLDPISYLHLGKIHIYFSDANIKSLANQTTDAIFNIVLIILFGLLVLLYFIRLELKSLRTLTKKIIEYDPQKNTLTLSKTNQTNEIGVIQNAIVLFVQKINLYTQELDTLNKTLEQKVDQRTLELNEANKKLEDLTYIDHLTKLPNRRKFNAIYTQLWELAQRHNVALSLILCDIDNFKVVNDTYGHQNGDIVLKTVANVMKSSIKREVDFITRYGGEEFIILLYETCEFDAKTLCLKIQQELKNLKYIQIDNKQIKPVTLSFGISSFSPEVQISQSELIEQADKALYHAKDLGRDEIVIYSQSLQAHQI